jgi:penicillin amidase
MRSLLHTTLLATLALSACKGAGDVVADPSPLLGVDETERFDMPGLSRPVYVVRTEANVPHIYAANQQDLARVHGFVVARDRFFMLDLNRRLAKGTLSELLGDAALETDIESRSTGMTAVAAHILGAVSDDERLWMQAFAEGVNAYVGAVTDGELPPPSEYDIAAPLLGANDPFELMQPFDDSDIAAMAATIVYQLGFETGDAGDGADFELIDGLFVGEAFEAERRAGVLDDVWGRVEPVYSVSSAPGWGTANDGPSAARSDAPDPAKVPHVPAVVRDRLHERLPRIQRRMRRDHDVGFGSNSWAVTGAASADGRSLLAGDGHLPLTVPSLFYQIGLDTEHFGGGDTHQMGLIIPGLPILAVGTNGQVAWSQTQLMGDITDWYTEELQLDAAGYPSATKFQGEWKTVAAVPERYEVADVPLLGSTGRSETWDRFTTFDGRWIFDIEGRGITAEEQEELAEGESVVLIGGDLIVPEDTDGDGVITAISFDYTGFQASTMITAVDGFGHANDVWEVRDATRGLIAYSQNVVASDANGSVLYTGYQAVPCRGYLPRDETGNWLPGAHPGLLLDGTTYGGFHIPVVDGRVVEGSDDPYECVVPFDEYPQSVDPDQGYVLTANNDIGNISTDGSLLDDPWYVGGPWTEGYRADTIDRRLASAVADGVADLDEMASIQADTSSAMGRQYADHLLQVIELAREDGAPDTPQARLHALYAADEAAWEEVHERITAWLDGGLATPSGVQTFYAEVGPNDPEDAIATSIFSTWMSRFIRNTFDDEGFPGLWRPGGSTGETRLLMLMLDGRGPGNPSGLSSWSAELQESVFFDVRGTDQVESSDEIAGIALADALARLRSDPVDGHSGGFGTDDMDQWLWGLRHWVHFDSILAEFLGGSEFAALTGPFSITPSILPLDDGISTGDPRLGMTGFPRPGDQFAVDAGNPGLDGDSYDYGSGPTFRMVIALGPDGVEGRNIVPGGQSALTDSPFFADQAALWLGNETLPMRFTVDEVIAGATGRETFWPATVPTEDNPLDEGTE